MSKLTDLDIKILRMMAGGPPIPWGAAVSASLEFLAGSGYAEQEGTYYYITPAGRRALQSQGGRDAA